MNVEDEEWVQHALIDFERKRCISKVLSMDCKNAIPKGNNYASDMLRLNMKVVLHSGEVENRSIIYKAMPQTAVRRSFIKEARLDKTEARMFTEVLPEMEKLRQEKDVGVEPLSASCYGIKRGLEGILLEDLTVLGYKMADRLELLDYNHAKLVMNAHAQFHALSAVLIERGDLSVSDYKESYFPNHPEHIAPLVHTTTEALAKEIEETWGSEWASYPSKLREYSKTAMSTFLDSFKFNQQNFNVLLHGDCWLTNMMFKYNQDGLPQSVRLLDFQLCNYNNVGQDLQYFFHSSLNGDTQKKKPELMKLYHEKLTSYLSLYGYSGEKPTFEQISECYNRASGIGLAIGLTFVPFIMQPQENIPEDLEKWTKDYLDEKAGFDSPPFKSENLINFLKELLKEGAANGIL